MKKNKGFILTRILPLIVLIGMVGLSLYLLAQKTGFLNRASELSTTTDYAISFVDNTNIGNSNSASVSGNYISVDPRIGSPMSLVLTFPFTIEGWFKTPKPASGNYLHAYSPLALQSWPSIVTNGYLYRLQFETQDIDGSTRPMFSIMKNNPQPYNNNNYLSVGPSSSVSMPANEWGHVAITASASGNLCYAQLYINGKMVDAQTKWSSSNCQTWTDSPTEFTLSKPISTEGGISGYYYPGMFNELRISSVVRYAGNFTPQRTPFDPDPSTIALWHFDQTVTDSSANGNNGVVRGNVSYVDALMIPPTATTLQSFVGVQKNTNRVLLTWATGSETNVLGFNLYRAIKKANGSFGKLVSLNAKMIEAKNVGQIQGASYRFTDDTVIPVNTYQYKIDVINANGQISETKTVKVKVTNAPPN